MFKSKKDFLKITGAILISAIGIYFFKFANNFSFGGITGLAVIVAKTGLISASDFSFVANILLFNRFIHNAIAVQFLSEKEKNNSYFKVNKIIGTNGIDIPQIIEKKDLKETIRIVYIGALLMDIKGIDLMLAAVYEKKFLLETNSIKVALYGPNVGNNHNNIVQMIKQLGIERIVEIHDSVYDEEKKRVLQEADIFIQTSRTEGMSMGLLEALAYGKPCLVTEGTNLDRIIEKYNAGWGVPTEISSIAKAFEKILVEREKWSEKAENAKILVEKEFAWDVVSNKTLNKYKELCKIME